MGGHSHLTYITLPLQLSRIIKVTKCISNNLEESVLILQLIQLSFCGLLQIQ